MAGLRQAIWGLNTQMAISKSWISCFIVPTLYPLDFNSLIISHNTVVFPTFELLPTTEITGIILLPLNNPTILLVFGLQIYKGLSRQQ